MKIKKIIIFVLILTLPAYFIFIKDDRLTTIVKKIILQYSSYITETYTLLDDIDINIFDSKATVYGYAIGNPYGFSNEPLFYFKKAEITFNRNTIFAKKIIINSITIYDFTLNYENLNNENNFHVLKKTILENLKKPPNNENNKYLNKITSKLISFQKLRIINPRISLTKDNEIIFYNSDDFDINGIPSTSNGLKPKEIIKVFVNEFESYLNNSIKNSA